MNLVEELNKQYNNNFEYLKLLEIVYEKQSDYTNKHLLMNFEDFRSVSFDALKDVSSDAGMDM